MKQKVILAYSGGLDTSICLKWLQEQYQFDVITLTLDLGQQKDLEVCQERARRFGASESIVVDARAEFVRRLAFPALQAGAVYEGKYPLATALGRPLIAKHLVELAHQKGAAAVAHGCSGKGNDQVRFDHGVSVLGPDLKVVAPVRERKASRTEQVEYAEEKGLHAEIDVKNREPYSTDENLWGRSIECGILEDLEQEPPEEVFRWTKSIADAPDRVEYIEIGFEQGLPVSLDGQTMAGESLVSRLNEIGGIHGIGRIDHVENRVVGIKSREIYEAPAATILHIAHRELEAVTLSREQHRLKSVISQYYADMIYDGLWFSSVHFDMRALVLSSQRCVTGTVRLSLHKGNCTIAGRKSPFSLYDKRLATYGLDDAFDSDAALGFIKLHGLSANVQIETQVKGTLDHTEAAVLLCEGKTAED